MTKTLDVINGVLTVWLSLQTIYFAVLVLIGRPITSHDMLTLAILSLWAVGELAIKAAIDFFKKKEA